MGQLTRAEMEEVIRSGGSILLNDASGVGQIHSTIGTLPTEADLAVGHEDRERVVSDSLDVQIAALAAQRQKIVEAQERRKRDGQAAQDVSGDANTNPETDRGAIPAAGIGGGITELPPQGDRIGAEESEEQNRVVRGEGAETDEEDGEGDGGSVRADGDDSGADADAAGEEPAAGKPAPRGKGKG